MHCWQSKVISTSKWHLPNPWLKNIVHLINSWKVHKKKERASWRPCCENVAHEYARTNLKIILVFCEMQTKSLRTQICETKNCTMKTKVLRMLNITSLRLPQQMCIRNSRKIWQTEQLKIIFYVCMFRHCLWRNKEKLCEFHWLQKA